MYERTMLELAHQKDLASQAIEELEERLREETVNHRALKRQIELHKLEAEPAIGEYKTLLLQHEELWRKHKSLQSAYQILLAAHDKEAMAHKRLAKLYRDNAIPYGNHLSDEILIRSPLLDCQREFRRFTGIGVSPIPSPKFGSPVKSVEATKDSHLQPPTPVVTRPSTPQIQPENPNRSSTPVTSIRDHSFNVPSPPSTVIHAPKVESDGRGRNATDEVEDEVKEDRFRSRSSWRESESTLDDLSSSMDATDSALVYTSASESVTSSAFRPSFKIFESGQPRKDEVTSPSNRTGWG
ncbi:hypothetical protein HDU67_004091, partial [Dinochytrium kinnereticum]